MASLSRHFVPLAACFSLCVLIAGAACVRWQDLPWDHRWIGPLDEVTEVEVSSGNAFMNTWHGRRIRFHCKALTDTQCTRVKAFREFVARHDFRAAELPPSAELALDHDSTTLTVRLKSGQIVEKYVYDYTENANFNKITRILSELEQSGLAESSPYPID